MGCNNSTSNDTTDPGKKHRDVDDLMGNNAPKHYIE